jgi:hypothetical protein
MANLSMADNAPFNWPTRKNFEIVALSLMETIDRRPSSAEGQRRERNLLINSSLGCTPLIHRQKKETPR